MCVLQKERDKAKTPNGDLEGFIEDFNALISNQLEDLREWVNQLTEDDSGVDWQTFLQILIMDNQQIQGMIYGAYKNTRFTRWLIALIKSDC